MFDIWLVVSAPADENSVGVVFGWRWDESISQFAHIISLRTPDRVVGDSFGFSVTLSDAFIVVGTPSRNDFRGAVWSYNGYEYFPLKPPQFFIPKDGVIANIGRIMEPLFDGDSFLINSTWPVHVTARFKKELTLARTDGVVPDPAVDFPLAELDGTPAAPAGGYLFLPFEQGNYTLTAVAYNGDFDFISEPRTVHLLLWVIEPGYYWHRFRYLDPCGAVFRFCPGLFEEPFRYLVDPAHYSTPLSAPEHLRSGQRECEFFRYCEGGRAFTCEPRTYCWPQPFRVEARQARVGERDPDGNDYFNRREFGVSVGDVIEVEFDEFTNEVRMNDTESILALFGFTERVAVGMSGKWVNSKELWITITEGSWFDPGMPDLELTRIGVLEFDILKTGNLRCVRAPVVCVVFAEVLAADLVTVDL